MRKSMRTLWVVLCCLTVATGYAQEVVKENGKIIIDASAIRHTKVKKARATDGTNARLGTDDETNIGSAASDEQVYYRFELSAARFSATWINAVNRCRNLADDGEPTPRGSGAGAKPSGNPAGGAAPSRWVANGRSGCKARLPESVPAH